MAVDNDANQAICPALLAPYAFLLGLPHTSIQPLSIHPEGIVSFHLIDLLGNIFYNLLFYLQGSTHLLTPLQCPPSIFPTLASSPPFQLHPSGRDSSEPQLVQPCLCSSNSSRSKELVLTHPRYLKGNIAIHSAGRNLYSAPPTPYPETSITTHPARRAFFSTPHKNPLSIHPSGRTLSTNQPC